jgi:hypothetical protein
LELLRLFTLPPTIQRRLCAAVAAAWIERDPDRAALVAALVGRARPALRAWAGDAVPVHLTIGPNRHARRSDDGAVSAELPTRWLVDVWGPGLALIDGHFVLDVQDGDAGHVRAVAPDGALVLLPVPA